MLATCVACAGNRAGSPAAAPRDGTALLNQMRDAYLGKWFRTVTFTQLTTQYRPNGVTDTTTWYEALLSPDRLRIDFGDISKGNGVIYTADSLYVVREGSVVRSVAQGNPFLPFVAGVYTQPIDSTLDQIAPYRFDLTRLRRDMFEGRPVYVVGSLEASDTTSPQFWVDVDRLVVVRMIVAFNPATPADVGDIALRDYRPVSGGWLAVKVDIKHGGRLIQKEEYSEWRGNVDLPRDFFVAEKWNAVPHWHR
ncbi:MAG TPA: hypothetical protein VFP37_01515 [Steroidobacteraceae bacterium]|nr:hypothetical protein [Steroidobacteraceae bacterium]